MQVFEQVRANRLAVADFAKRIAVRGAAQDRPHDRDASGTRPILDDEGPF